MAIRVLIANSSGIAREIIRNHLECMGCNVVAEAETAAQTINLFRTVRPQVITMDLGLKPSEGLDALEVFRSIRHEEPEASVMIMGATDHGDKSRIFLSEGALDCIVEPFDSAGFERMWRCLSDHYPELRRSEPAPNLQVARGGRGNRY
jgi:chemotaxis response regulator CheB